MSNYIAEIFKNQNAIESLKCLLCSHILKDPVVVDCGASYCRQCVLTGKENNTLCPQSQTPLDSIVIRHNFVLHKYIETLEARCLNFASSCAFEGKLLDVEAHVSSTCEFQELACDNKDCGKKIQRKDKSDHSLNCDYRALNCEKCSEVVPAVLMESHQGKCLKSEINCEHKCGAKFLRKNSDYHNNEICPNVVMKCVFANEGCSFTDFRRRIRLHEGSYMGFHLRLQSQRMNALDQFCQNSMVEIMKSLKLLPQKDMEVINNLEKLLQNRLNVSPVKSSIIFQGHISSKGEDIFTTNDQAQEVVIFYKIAEPFQRITFKARGLNSEQQIPFRFGFAYTSEIEEYENGKHLELSGLIYYLQSSKGAFYVKEQVDQVFELKENNFKIDSDDQVSFYYTDEFNGIVMENLTKGLSLEVKTKETLCKMIPCFVLGKEIELEIVTMTNECAEMKDN